jgi:hypothetical protein
LRIRRKPSNHEVALKQQDGEVKSFSRVIDKGKSLEIAALSVNRRAKLTLDWSAPLGLDTEGA